MNPIVLLVIVLLLLIVLKVPIAFSLGITGILYMLLFPGDVSAAGLLDKMIMGIYNYTFLAVPFFILAGSMMNTTGISERIFNFALSLVGHIKGGLGHVNIIASIIFSGMSGSAVADTAGLGKIEIEAMKKAGYTPEFSACITAASATIGPIIPPSVTMVIYGVISGASIGRLFLGGIVPGLLMGLALMVLVYFQAKKDPKHFPSFPAPTAKNVWENFKKAFLPLWAPVIILGGIIIGFVTPTEAGVLAVLYALILGIYYREFRFKDLQATLVETARQVGAVMLILAGARVLSYVMTLQRIPILLTNWMIGFTDNAAVVLLLINIAILILGMFLNSSTILILTIPIIQPILQKYGIDLVHFGVVITLNVMIGMITPPLGVCLYIASDIAGVRFERVLKDIIPFYIPLIIVLLLITYIPGLVLWFPDLLMK